jgi:hypothetical protein
MSYSLFFKTLKSFFFLISVMLKFLRKWENFAEDRIRQTPCSEVYQVTV